MEKNVKEEEMEKYVTEEEMEKFVEEAGLAKYLVEEDEIEEAGFNVYEFIKKSMERRKEGGGFNVYEFIKKSMERRKEEEAEEMRQRKQKFSRRYIMEEKQKTIASLLEHQQEMMSLCCLFDDNYEFEREKLQQLWIAGSFMSKEHFEDHAQQMFDILLEKFEIFHSRVDIFTGTTMYKVKANELKAALSPMPTIEDFQLRLDDNNVAINSSVDCWHISVRRENIDQSTFETLKRFKELKTLLFLNGSGIKQVPSDMFSALKSLTSIDLSGSCITELPSSICNVKKLCFLDLSRTPIKILPESIVCLQKLQTLRLKGCVHLFKLPRGMKKLVNLRHLDFDILGQLSYMPRGIGSLVELRTLTAFIVDYEEMCNIVELKRMNNLSGRLCISGLEFVDPVDAKAAALSFKQNLKQLELRWSDAVQMNARDEGFFDEVLAHLKPNYCLEELQIICFPGVNLPKWVSSPSYGYFVSITLYKCENCMFFPSLGRLPKLMTLNVVEMNHVQTIDDDKMFANDIAYAWFPMLEMLAIDGMFCLQCWKSLAHKGYPRLVKLSLKRCPNLIMIYSFSQLGSLKHLEVNHCGLLVYFPSEILLSPLESLTIDACPLLLKTRFFKGGADCSKIKHVPNVWMDVKDTQSADDDSISTEVDIYDVKDIHTVTDDPADDNIIIHEGTSNLEELESEKGDKRGTQMSGEVVISTAREIASQDHFHFFSHIKNLEQEVQSLTMQEKQVTDPDTPSKSYEQNMTISMETVVQLTETPTGNSAEDSEGILRKENTEGYNEDGQSTRVAFAKQALLAEADQHYSGTVYINGKVIQHHLLKCAEKIAGSIKPGEYWYDAKAGFWGVMGHYCLGIMPPCIQELSFPMPINCSGGNTTICVNGRELHQRDLDLLVARGLPTINNKKYIIDIQGTVLDEETNEFIVHLGRIAPTSTVVMIDSTPGKDQTNQQKSLVSEEQRLKFEKDNRLVCTRILANMADSLFDLYVGYKKAKEIWDLLANKYGEDDSGMKKFIVSTFMRYKIHDDKPVMEQVHAFENICAEIKTEGMELPEVFLAHVLLDKLPTT